MSEAIPLHKKYAETGEVTGIEAIESPFKSVAGNDGSGKRGLSDSQRCVTKRGKEANHGEF
ncbi:MAG: hypothetical protein JWP25_4703 [Bradyrhizobium sp.]|nr:hypothetical protein [Bradyrhizobium sp.]